jgi:hypothetical protein
MNDLISPKYQMKLVKSVSDAIWLEFPSYEQVRYYINKWHEDNYEQMVLTITIGRILKLRKGAMEKLTY